MESKSVVQESLNSKENTEYYDVAHIDKLNCHYNVIFGKRSNGKTYSILKKIVKNYAEKGERLWDIAKKYSITREAIALANGIGSSDIPSVIKIPS